MLTGQNDDGRSNVKKSSDDTPQLPPTTTLKLNINKHL